MSTADDAKILAEANALLAAEQAVRRGGLQPRLRGIELKEYRGSAAEGFHGMPVKDRQELRQAVRASQRLQQR